MKAALISAAISSMFILEAARGNEVRIEFSEKAAGKFAGEVPLEAKVVERNGELDVVVSNLSADFIALTKNPSHQSWDYRFGDEWKTMSGSTIMCATESLDHVVLVPAGTNRSILSSWTVYKTTPQDLKSAPAASAVRFNLGLAGYFPSLGDYEGFQIIVTVRLDPTEGKRDDAGQPDPR